MARSRKKLGQYLVRWGIIDEQQLEEALKVSEGTSKRIGQVLVEMGYCKDEDVAKALANQFDMEYIDLDTAREMEPVFLDGRAADWVAPDRYEMRPDARRFEEWESSIANRIGLGVAVDYALEIGVAEGYERIQALASELRAGLDAVPGVTVVDQGRERCGIVTFTLDGMAPSEVKARLREQRINVNTIDPSNTLLDSEARGLGEIVRSSVHYYNSEDEVGRLVEAVAALA